MKAPYCPHCGHWMSAVTYPKNPEGEALFAYWRCACTEINLPSDPPEPVPALPIDVAKMALMSVRSVSSDNLPPDCPLCREKMYALRVETPSGITEAWKCDCLATTLRTIFDFAAKVEPAAPAVKEAEPTTPLTEVDLFLEGLLASVSEDGDDDDDDAELPPLQAEPALAADNKVMLSVNTTVETVVALRHLLLWLAKSSHDSAHRRRKRARNLPNSLFTEFRMTRATQWKLSRAIQTLHVMYRALCVSVRNAPPDWNGFLAQLFDSKDPTRCTEADIFAQPLDDEDYASYIQSILEGYRPDYEGTTQLTKPGGEQEEANQLTRRLCVATALQIGTARDNRHWSIPTTWLEDGTPIEFGDTPVKTTELPQLLPRIKAWRVAMDAFIMADKEAGKIPRHW